MSNGAAATNAFCAACTFIINALRLQATTTSSIQSKNNMEATKGPESVNKETSAADIKVETVDYRSPPGDNSPTLKENVEIIHQTVDEEGGPGAIRKGLAAVGRAAESAKDAITGTKNDKPESG